VRPVSLFVTDKAHFGIFSVLLAKRIAEKKEKVAVREASHKKCVSPCVDKSSAQCSLLIHRAA